MREVVDKWIKESALENTRKKLVDLFYVLNKLLEINGNGYEFGKYRAHRNNNYIIIDKYKKIKNHYDMYGGFDYNPSVSSTGECKLPLVKNAMEVYSYVQNNIEHMLLEMDPYLDYADSFGDIAI